MTEKKVSEMTCQARFGSIKEDIIDIKAIVNNMKTNHLAHVQKDIAWIKAYIMAQIKEEKERKEAEKNKKDWAKWIVPLSISIFFTIIQILLAKGII